MPTLQPITVPTLLDTASARDGARVLVWGVLRSSREELSLGTDDEAGPRVWVSPGQLPAGRLPRGGVVAVEGTFRAGPSGHLDRYPGALDAITRVEKVR